jgi:DNA-binding NarL/FixJ family response regulator
VATLLICDGVAGMRETLARCAAGVPGVDRVDTAASGAEALARIPLQLPDIVLVDAGLPGGAETVRTMLAENPRALVFVLGSPQDEAALSLALSAGARGFLHKDLSREELAVAITHAMSAHPVPGEAPRPQRPAVDLTEREMQVLRGMCEGKSNNEIGRDLFLSEDTVKTHARRLFRKLGVNDRAHAVASGFRLGLVS